MPGEQQASADPYQRPEVAELLEGAPAPETPTGQSRLAYRLAAIVLFLGMFVNIIDLLLAAGEDSVRSITAIVIDFALAIGLLQLRQGARKWVLFRAGLGAVLWPIIAFIDNDALTAIIVSIVQWGFVASLMLLLTGESKPWRLVVAIGVFVVFTLGTYAVLLLLILLASQAGF